MPYTKVRLLSVFVILQIAAVLPALAQFSPTKIMNALQNRPSGLTLVASHRGEIFGSYANNMPENSIGSGLNAVYAGMEMIEVDVWTTQDGVPYLMHDKSLYRMLNDRIESNYQANPSKPPAATWGQVENMPLCAGRGQTIANDYHCDPTVISQTPPSLTGFVDTIASTIVPGFQNPWGGVIQLDIRDPETLRQSWTTLVGSGNSYVNDQVIFKFSPAKLKLYTPTELITFLAQSTFYNGNTNAVISDLQSHMNVMPVYQTEDVNEMENTSKDPNWAINNWKAWAAASSSFRRLLSPMVGVKGDPGKFVGSSDPLYVDVVNGAIPGGGNLLNTVGVYSTYYECYNSQDGQANLPNQPSNPYYNGFFSTGGKCATILPAAFSSTDRIDHRYDYTFISDTLDFGMIIADTAGELVNYLIGKNLRDLSSIRYEIAAPINLTVKNIHANSFTVAWTDPNPPSSVVPTYTASICLFATCTVGSTNTLSYTFTGLSSSKFYRIAISEQIGQANSDPSLVAIATTLGPTAGIFSDKTPFGSGLTLDGSHSLSLTAIQAAIATNPLQSVVEPPNLWSAIQGGPETEVPIAPGKYSQITMMALAAGGGSQADQTFTVNYTNNTSQTFTQGVSDWHAPQGYPNEYAAVKTGYRLNEDGSQDKSGAYYVYQYTFAVDPSLTVQSITLPDNSKVWVLDIVPYTPYTPVDLSWSANVVGIANDGSLLNAASLDENGYGYSAQAFGTYAAYNGTSFLRGTPNMFNAVLSEGQTVPLTQGNYSMLNLIGTGTDGDEPNQHFFVDYTDGTTQTFTQTFSDWGGVTTYPGQSIVGTMSYRDFIAGGLTPDFSNHIYGYSFVLNNTKVVKDVRLPLNPNVAILGMNLTQQVPNGLWLGITANLSGIMPDGQPFASTGGLDLSGHAYSQTAFYPELPFPTTGLQVAQSRWWNGIPFTPYQSPGGWGWPGTTLSLATDSPNSTYSWLYILGTSVNGTQHNVHFRVCYTVGSCDPAFNQTFTDWTNSGSYSFVQGESRTAIMDYRNVYDRSKEQKDVYVYVYAIPLDKSRTPAYLMGPTNSPASLNTTIENFTLQQ